MDNIGYTSLTRQTGLWQEMQTVANNIANASTTGFRREGVIFSEYIHALGNGEASLSMAAARGRVIDQSQGALSQTGGAFDFAIEGDGFFQVSGETDSFLTRAGSFTPSSEGELVTPDGLRLLDSGGAPITIPTDANLVSVAADGTVSANGKAIAQIGLYLPDDPNELLHQNGSRFQANSNVQPAITNASILQGFLEGSNVNPISEITRMIEIQRSYEMGQHFLDQEDKRIRSVIETTTK